MKMKKKSIKTRKDKNKTKKYQFNPKKMLET